MNLSLLPRPLTDVEVSELLHAASDTREALRDRAIVALLIDAGPSRSELVRLVHSDYDPDDGVISIGVGESSRRVPLGRISGAAIDALVNGGGLPTAPLLRSRSGVPVTDRAVHELLCRLSAAGELGFVATCRHTRRTWLHWVLQAFPGPVVARLANHHPARMPRATSEEALAVLLEIGWISPLDRALADPTLADMSRHAA
jgi:integrase